MPLYRYQGYALGVNHKPCGSLANNLQSSQKVGVNTLPPIHGPPIRGGSRGRMQGCALPPPPEMAYWLLKFVYLTSQLHHPLVVHPPPKKNLDPPLPIQAGR